MPPRQAAASAPRRCRSARAGQVRREGADPVAVTRQPQRCARERRRVAIDEQHGRAARQQLVGDRAADAATAAGHQGTDGLRLHAVLLCGSVTSRERDVQAAEDLPVQPVDAARAADHGLAILGLGQACEDRGEVVDVFLVELAVAAQVGERARRQGRGSAGSDRPPSVRARHWCLRARAPCRRSRADCGASRCRRRRRSSPPSRSPVRRRPPLHGRRRPARCRSGSIRRGRPPPRGSAAPASCSQRCRSGSRAPTAINSGTVWRTW